MWSRTEAAGVPVTRTETHFDIRDRPIEHASGTQEVVAQNTFTYNDLRDLTGEAQMHLPGLDAVTGFVGYTWQFSPLAAYNFHRLTGITYPARQGQSSGRTVALDYGNNTDSLDSALSRVTKLTDSSLNELAAFTYAGSGRRVGRTFGGGTVAQSIAGGGGYTGLDRFGRVIDLHYPAPAARCSGTSMATTPPGIGSTPGSRRLTMGPSPTTTTARTSTATTRSIG